MELDKLVEKLTELVELFQAANSKFPIFEAEISRLHDLIDRQSQLIENLTDRVARDHEFINEISDRLGHLQGSGRVLPSPGNTN